MIAGEAVPTQPLIVQLLLESGSIDTKRLRELPERDNDLSDRTLIRAGLTTAEEIARLYAAHLGVPLYDPQRGGVQDTSQQLGRLLPEKLCRDQLIAPVGLNGGELEVAFVTPHEMLIIDEIQLLTGLRVSPLIAPLPVVESMIEATYSSSDQSSAFVGGAEDFEQVDDEIDDEVDEDDDGTGTLHLDQPPPPGRNGRIIRMVNQILEQAIRSGASDIHLEPFEETCKIRLRIDGKLQELPALNRRLFITIVSRFKILAKMDIAEKRIPQDGAIALRSGEKRIDLRVSTMPTVFGEKVVMRLLDKAAIPLELGGLGFDARQTSDLVEAIKMPHGLLLVTGPTGSGKSTTLYTCLNLLNEPATNICTVEDPVEYKFKGLNQVQVKAQIGLTFASALRAFLRQDPDVIMVGEVRDQETAQICLRAALTGHFVLSTIHTNDALSSITRLQDMGVEPFLLSCTLRAVEAQRLLRRLCPACRKPYDCDAETARRYGMEQGMTLYRPGACDRCRGTGYRGRVGVFEVIRITPRLASLIQARVSLPELRAASQEEGMKLLVDSALDKARQGLTSLEVALSIAISEDE